MLLSVDLATPPVTIDFRSLKMKRTALAPIDHAPLRIVLQYRFRAATRQEATKRLDGAKFAAATTDLHFAFHRGGAEEGAVKFKQIETNGPGSTPRPKLGMHGKFHWISH